MKAPRLDGLLKAVEAEPVQRDLSDYRAVMVKLVDEKRFTFLQVAIWLTKHGVKCAASQVHREYCRAKQGCGTQNRS